MKVDSLGRKQTERVTNFTLLRGRRLYIERDIHMWFTDGSYEAVWCGVTQQQVKNGRMIMNKHQEFITAYFKLLITWTD